MMDGRGWYNQCNLDNQRAGSNSSNISRLNRTSLLRCDRFVRRPEEEEELSEIITIRLMESLSFIREPFIQCLIIIPIGVVGGLITSAN